MKITNYFLLLGLLFGSCRSTTVITSDVRGAEIYINDEFCGKDSCEYKTRSIVGTSTNILIKKEGYKDFKTTISRTEKLNVGALVGGLFILPFFLWIMNHKPTHNYKLVKTHHQNQSNTLTSSE